MKLPSWLHFALGGAHEEAHVPAPHLVIPLRAVESTETVISPDMGRKGNGMSVLSTIVVDVKTFFADLGTDVGKFASAFVKLFKKAPSALQVVENFTAEAAPIIIGAVELADPVAEPEVAAALSVAETGLAALQASATAATSGQSLLTNLQSFATTVPQLLTGLQIKNPALQAAVTKIVNLITAEAKVLIPAVEAWVKQISGSTATATS